MSRRTRVCGAMFPRRRRSGGAQARCASGGNPRAPDKCGWAGPPVPGQTCSHETSGFSAAWREFPLACTTSSSTSCALRARTLPIDRSAARPGNQRPGPQALHNRIVPQSVGQLLSLVCEGTIGSWPRHRASYEYNLGNQHARLTAHTLRHYLKWRGLMIGAVKEIRNLLQGDALISFDFADTTVDASVTGILNLDRAAMHSVPAVTSSDMPDSADGRWSQGSSARGRSTSISIAGGFAGPWDEDAWARNSGRKQVIGGSVPGNSTRSARSGTMSPAGTRAENAWPRGGVRNHRGAPKRKIPAS